LGLRLIVWLRLSGSKLCKQWSGNAIDRKSLESAVLIKLSRGHCGQKKLYA